MDSTTGPCIHQTVALIGAEVNNGGTRGVSVTAGSTACPVQWNVANVAAIVDLRDTTVTVLSAPLTAHIATVAAGPCQRLGGRPYVTGMPATHS
jgi:hypothetical protein